MPDKKASASDLEYKPVPLNRKKELARAMRRPGFKTAWKALDKKYAALAILLASRKRRAGKQREAQTISENWNAFNDQHGSFAGEHLSL